MVGERCVYLAALMFRYNFEFNDLSLSSKLDPTCKGIIKSEKTDAVILDFGTISS